MANHPNRNRTLQERATAALARARAEFEAQHTPDGQGAYFSTGPDAERTADALRVVSALARGEAAPVTMLYHTPEQVSRLLTRLGS